MMMYAVSVFAHVFAHVRLITFSACVFGHVAETYVYTLKCPCCKWIAESRT